MGQKYSGRCTLNATSTQAAVGAFWSAIASSPRPVLRSRSRDFLTLQAHLVSLLHSPLHSASSLSPRHRISEPHPLQLIPSATFFSALVRSLAVSSLIPSMDQSTQPPLARRSSYQAAQDSLTSDSGVHISQHDPAGFVRDSEDAPPMVKSTDMPDVLQQHAIQATLKARQQAKEEGQRHNDAYRSNQCDSAQSLQLQSEHRTAAAQRY